MVPFTRQLGARSGIQLNPIKDATERFVAGDADQAAAWAGRFERGRIDKAFTVDRSNLSRKLGKSASTLVSRLNETYVHVYEAIRAGTQEAIIWRLVPGAAAVLKYMTATADAVAGNVWSTPTAVPETAHVLSLKHLECFNDGVRAEINAPQTLGEDLDATATANVPLTGATPLTIGAYTVANGDRVKLTAQTTSSQNGTYTVGITGGTYTLTLAETLVPVATKEIVIRLKDRATGEIVVGPFAGSLDPAAVDEFNQSRYIASVVSARTDVLEVSVYTGASVLPTCAFYGVDVNGDDKFVGADLDYFVEGGTSYTNTDYDAACTGLKQTEYNFGAIGGGGSRSTALLSKLGALGKDINKQFVYDIPGEYTPAQAIAMLETLSFDTHYAQAYWAPLKADDPLNGGKDWIGTSGIQIGYRCARNARTDANGVAPKNFATAGKDWPLTRTGIVQTYTPSETELNNLAKARAINPVIFQRFATGGRYVFADVLTCAKTEADRKLVTVADMSSTVDDNTTMYGQETLLKPMATAVKLMQDFLQKYFEGLQAAKWIIPSDELDGAAFEYEVKPNALRPSDRMDVAYALHYDGCNRAIYFQQTLSK